MRKILLVLGLVFVTIFSGACAEDDGMGKGKTMVLNFETNPTTGYGWEYKFLEGSDKAEISLLKDDFQVNNDTNLLGAPSRQLFYFRAKKPGKQSLTFTYRRPWQGGETAYDVVYELSVDKKLNIKCLSKMKGEVPSEVELSFFPDPTFED